MLEFIYSDEQLQAITLCGDLSVKIASVTGQAGSGKTTTLLGASDAVYNACIETIGFDAAGAPKFSIAIAAPTGRAAKRVEEATGIKAMTIHRMLRYTAPEDDKDITLPAYNKLNPMPYDAIFIDEASMLSVELRRSLIDAMKRGCVIRFFGDINQLPPIGSVGSDSRKNPSFSPFSKDLVKFPSVTLSKNFRSTDGIVELADRIIRNRMPQANDQVEIHRIMSTDTGTRILALANIIDFTSDNSQIITPTNKTVHGTEVINRVIQTKFNKEKESITVWKTNKDGELVTRKFKRGDKILWTDNNYDLGLMNGTLGRILDFNTESGTIHISVDGRDMAIPSQMEVFNKFTGKKFIFDPRTQMQLGYAITTHKAQGSQFNTVLFISSRSRALTRQNIYTAVTRAKERLIIFNVGGSISYGLETKVNITNETFS